MMLLACAGALSRYSLAPPDDPACRPWRAAFMRHCILHIGIPKTGSKSIQQTLYMNRDRLAKAGILYQTTLDPEDGTVAHHKLGANLRGSAKQNRLTGITLSEFGEILRTTSADIVVISSESLSNPHLNAEKVHRLAQLITGNGFIPTAVAYIRPQPSLANSEYGRRLNRSRSMVHSPTSSKPATIGPGMWVNGWRRGPMSRRSSSLRFLSHLKIPGSTSPPKCSSAQGSHQRGSTPSISSQRDL